MRIGSFSLIKELNTSIILNTIRDYGSVSRAQIAKHTGLTPATVTNITGALISHKLIKETSLGRSNGGRKPVMLELNETEFLVIGVTVGNDSIDIILSDLNEDTHLKQKIPCDDGISADEAMDKIIKVIKHIINETDNRILGIGFAVKGLTDAKRGVLVLSSDLGWENIPIREVLEEAVGIPVFVDNDVKTITLGEKWFGMAKHNDDFVLLYLGFGVGAAMVTNGHIYRGAMNYASEIGHTTIKENGPLCSCGNRGCLQTLASESSLLRQISDMGFDDLYFENQPITAKAVIYKAQNGNNELLELVKRQAYYTGIAVANIINIFNPPLIILNGYLDGAGEEIMGVVTEQVEKRSLKFLNEGVPIVFSQLREKAIYKGCIALVLSQVFKDTSAFFGGL